jgi:WD40 repeat protein
VVTASADRTARLWDGNSGAPIATLAGHGDWVNGVAFSVDGARIVTASFDGTARVWDAARGTLLAILAGHTDRILSAKFTRDGTRIVTASADHTVRIWDAEGGTVLATLSGPAGEVAAAAFSPDGTHVVAASLDHSAYVWRLDPLTLMQADRRRAYVCRERLIGAPSFSDREMQDPLLRGREELRKPCDHLGPLSASYYRHRFAGLIAAVRDAFSH